ncbi:hypothetical protein Hypma_007067 [Hypsizygus marmoreus]|uniref:Uncharacterized protein n=1 Tax=Hypsizygus marmoreus TaxID=39966 RepID=A0A369KFF9_HYPMA|nr:hypothetical protein Hypma_007067 [Hypsizygus marmoreus]
MVPDWPTLNSNALVSRYFGSRTQRHLYETVYDQQGLAEISGSFTSCFQITAESSFVLRRTCFPVYAGFPFRTLLGSGPRLGLVKSSRRRGGFHILHRCLPDPLFDDVRSLEIYSLSGIGHHSPPNSLIDTPPQAMMNLRTLRLSLPPNDHRSLDGNAAV